MRSRGLTLARALIVCIAVMAAALAVPRGAAATDLDSLRARAQGIADQVTGLEHRLASLNSRRAILARRVEMANARIGELELEIHHTERAYEAAKKRYVRRAVLAYKAGTSARLELFLSAQNFSQLFTYARAASESAALDRRALDRLLAAKQAAERSQSEIDENKQKVLVAQRSVSVVADRIASTLSQRKATLSALTRRVRRLEAQARLQAAAAAQPSAALTRLLSSTGPSRGIPNGYVGTGVSFEGLASWYGPGFEGNPTASGAIFDPQKFTAASRDLPLGTWLYVEHEGRGVVVLVNDRGPYIDERILDLSQAAAQAIGISGVGWVRAEILLKK